ncbi:MAG: trypsin-like peptidase domain-containing protein [Erysipelotrichaceae bacterium]|nr:trypsin-like peptidase domain-containing protein [Erysipelotrichaceae bacterium]
MKINFKSLMIIFLVAILGSSLGTFGVLSLYNKNTPTQDTNLVINEVDYLNTVTSDYSSAIDKAYNTVVEINAEIIQSGYYFFGGTTKGTSAGSGVIISEDGYIVTNNHVIEDASGENAITVKLSDGSSYTATVIGADDKSDLALLKIDATGLPYSSFADSSTLVMGQEVIAIGNPLGEGISCSNGIISALEKEIYINGVYLSVLQTNAAVNSGNSGGGLFDINGNLVGISNAKSSNSTSGTTVEGMGYAIPSNKVVSIVTDLKDNGYVKDRPALGIYASRYSTVTSGVLVTDVLSGGSAEKAGIQAEDIIVSMDDTEITSYGDLVKELEKYNVGDTVKIGIIRNSQQLYIDVTLQESSNG